MAQVEVDFDLCIGCRFCAIVCPEGVFALRSEVLAVPIAAQKCTLCMKCVGKNGCPERAIRITAQRAGAMAS